MRSEQNEPDDPRARWRQLPPEPQQLIEETAVDTRVSGVELGVNPEEESIRRNAG